MSSRARIVALLLSLGLIAGIIIYSESVKTGQAPSGGHAVISLVGAPAATLEEKAKKYPRAKEITDPSGFINTDPFKIADLVGRKVILVDFWTYSCINCQRTIPYLNEWYKKYQSQGLEIVGIHTPEFDFEKSLDNVRSAVKRFGIIYPVVLDNDQGTWNAYGNQYWPRHYLIDIDGFIVEDHIGEGGYDQTEAKIQDLLSERMDKLGLGAMTEAPITEPSNTIDIDFSGVKSPETYFGYARNQYLGNGIPFIPGTRSFDLPKNPDANKLYLGGKWNIQKEYATTAASGAKIIFKYQAKNVYFVAGSPSTSSGQATAGTAIKVLRDGKPLGREAGADVAPDGSVNIKENRLYDLIRGSDYGEHVLEIQIENPGLQAFTFTFG